jgi:UDP-glucose 4-epimerase
VHLAAHVSVPESVRAPRAAFDANVTGTLNVLEAARDHGAQVIVASSASVYGPSSAPLQREDQAPQPVSPYAASKLAAEYLALSWNACYGLPTLALRFFNVFGPRQLATDAYAAVVPAFVSQALAGGPLVVHGDGRQRRDFVPVGTVADVVTRAVLERTTWPTPVNVALGASTSLLELVALLERTLGRSLDVHHETPRDGDLPTSCGDGTLLHRLFPSIPPPDLAAALAETVHWHVQQATPAAGR